MNPSLTPGELKRIQHFIERNCGIAITDDKAYLIESRLSGIMSETGFPTYDVFFSAAEGDSRLMERIIDAITTNETLWFRDQSPWLILERILIPQYIRLLRQKERAKIRIWSAGCSTGQEPYSIAMCIDNYLTRSKITDISLCAFEILASDISRSALASAQAGQYDGIAITRGLDEHCRNIYFQHHNGIWKLDDRIRNAVTFRLFNLQHDFYGLGDFDLIFCRYTLIYFSDDLKKQILAKIYRCLKDNGVLMIGSSELLMDYSNLFSMEQCEGGVFYLRKGNAG